MGVGDVVEFLLLGLRWGNLYELKDNTVSDISSFCHLPLLCKLFRVCIEVCG